MGAIGAKILVGIAARLLTERFVSKMVVYSLRAISEKTPTKLDDKAIEAMAEALGVE